MKAIKLILKIIFFLIILFFTFSISLYIQQVPVERRFLSPFYLFVSFYIPYLMVFSKKGKKLIWGLPILSTIRRIGFSFVNSIIRWIQLNIIETNSYQKIKAWLNKPLDINWNDNTFLFIKYKRSKSCRHVMLSSIGLN